jgi:transcriptional regulator with XRE-family HTH domain
MVNGKKIRRLREAMGLTQRVASAKCGWRSVSVWSDTERGRRMHITADTLYLIARVLNCTMDELMLTSVAPRRKIAEKRLDA